MYAIFSLEERISLALVHNITFFEDVIDIRMSGSPDLR